MSQEIYIQDVILEKGKKSWIKKVIFFGIKKKTLEVMEREREI